MLAGRLARRGFPCAAVQRRADRHRDRRGNAPEEGRDKQPLPADEQPRRSHELDIAETESRFAFQQAAAQKEQQKEAESRCRSDEPCLPADANPQAEHIKEQRRDPAQSEDDEHTVRNEHGLKIGTEDDDERRTSDAGNRDHADPAGEKPCDAAHPQQTVCKLDQRIARRNACPAVPASAAQQQI